MTARRPLRAIGRTTGVGHVARAAVDMHDAAINRLVIDARRLGVSEAKIRVALRAKRAADRMQNLVAILFPFVPSPAVMRGLAGRRAR